MRSVYIHIPFCKKICTYCDFCKVLYNEDIVDKYLCSLNDEINKNYKNNIIKTIYIGGGTPSSLSIKQLTKLFNIVKVLKTSKNYEFTFECNINDISKELLVILKNHKVNRISIGIETFNEKFKQILGRYEKGVKDKINLVKKYFDNINIDLIYGINGQTIDDLKNDLNEFILLDVPHISIYSLILEDNTMLKINGFGEIDDDLNFEMYNLIRKTLNSYGYIHYEISNFSKKGYKSKHNLTYWNNEEYYGFGCGASGYINNIRYDNTKNINKYINGNYLMNKEVQTKRKNMENEMILGLRKIKGVSKYKFYKKYNENICDIFNTSKLNENKANYYIDKKYLFISNYILKDFIDTKL